MTNSANNNKLETRPIGKLLFELSVPTITAQLVNLLYNIVDRVFVGRIEGSGSLALAGLGVTFPIIMLISAFTCLIGMGGAPRAAIAMGRKDNAAAEKTLGNCFSMLLIFSAVLAPLFMIIKDDVLLAFGADSGTTLKFASEYIGIYLCGTVFVQISLGLNTFITCQGFSKFSMLTVVIGAIINLVLDPIFIYGFNMGVSGAALATVVSQGVSACWVLAFLLGKKTKLRIKLSNMKLSWPILMPVLTLGISPFVMQATECLVQLTFNTGMKTFGDDNYVALMSILFSVMQVIWMPLSGFTQGAQPILSYNYGAGNKDRVKKTFRLLFAGAMIFSLTTVLLIELFPGIVLGIFTPDTAIIEIGKPAIRVFMAGMLIMGAQNACQQTFLALGEAKISMFLALLRKVILLFPLAMILPRVTNLGVYGLFSAEAIADVLAVATTTTLFTLRSRKLLSAMTD